MARHGTGYCRSCEWGGTDRTRAVRFESPTRNRNPDKASAMARKKQPGLRRLVVILGDQLDPNSAALDGFDTRHDAVWMAEVAEESNSV